MPNYEYECPECGHPFELYRPFAEYDAPAPCPSCKIAAKRKIFASPIVLGQGFFKHMSSGKPDDIIVNYPDGHNAHKTHNELYQDGGL